MDDLTRLLEKIERLTNLGMGDASRLEHIRRCIVENKKIYNSDIQYLQELETRFLDNQTKNPNEPPSGDSGVLCWRCSEKLVPSAKFCSFCGAKQDQEHSEFDQILSRRAKREYNPLKIVLGFHSYQILAVIGGLAALIPILSVTLNLNRVFEIIEFYTGRDMSGLAAGFVSLGIFSGALCVLVIVIPFLIKKPKKVGKILFFSSFGILFSSIFVGIAGFVLVLFAGIFALKKRRY